MFTHLVDTAKGKHPLVARRSSRWPTLRKQHLAVSPCCVVCGNNVGVSVHHIKPFHIYPELELEPSNLITLCEGGRFVNCHLIFGHLGSFKSYNIDVQADAEAFATKLKNRPMAKQP